MSMSAQIKTIFSCSNCDAQYPKWQGRCLECGQWGTIQEIAEDKKSPAANIPFDNKKLVDFNNLSSEKFERLETHLREIDQVFGGGIVQGSLTLIGGEPGIGKSTLVLQIFKQLEEKNSALGLLYISGEESAEQINLRLQRIDYKPKKLQFLSETNVSQICSAIQHLKPALAIIDSIQTVYTDQIESEAGSVSQIRGATVKLLEVAKSTGTAVIITGHVTKDGSLAGPKTLEHLVDVVLYLEGDKLHGFRLLRSFKNRFGSTNEIGLLEMSEKGLLEVSDPTKIFLQTNDTAIAGSVISCFLEGNRAFLIEVQALVTPTVFGYPQRKAAGYDLNRLQIICAILFKRAGLNLTNQDIHLNIAGGIKVTEPAIDLAVALAIISALKNQPLAKDTVVLGELGLGGEVRPTLHLEKRLAEAEKLGFKNAIIPEAKITKQFNLKLQKIKNIKEILNF